MKYLITLTALALVACGEEDTVKKNGEFEVFHKGDAVPTYVLDVILSSQTAVQVSITAKFATDSLVERGASDTTVYCNIHGEEVRIWCIDVTFDCTDNKGKPCAVKGPMIKGYPTSYVYRAPPEKVKLFKELEKGQAK